MQKRVSLIRSHLFSFAFITVALPLGDRPKTAVAQFMLRKVLPELSVRSFTVSCLMRKSLSHFEFLFCMVWGRVLTSWTYIQMSDFPTHLLKRLFPILYSCLLCGRLIDCRCVSLFLGSLFCSIDLYVCFLNPVPYCFDYHSFVVLSEVWESYASCFVFSSGFALAILGLL